VNRLAAFSAPLLSGDIPQELMLLWQRLAVAGRTDSLSIPNLHVIVDTLLAGPLSNVSLYKKVAPSFVVV
jgi:hypothetical protein